MPGQDYFPNATGWTRHVTQNPTFRECKLSLLQKKINYALRIEKKKNNKHSLRIWTGYQWKIWGTEFELKTENFMTNNNHILPYLLYSLSPGSTSSSYTVFLDKYIKDHLEPLSFFLPISGTKPHPLIFKQDLLINLCLRYIYFQMFLSHICSHTQ